ncbi:hypothetical protein IFM89_025754 [Coptis chinensis]|uniref:Uncharacterized protein n=1 Tax=Coptis chinensis TaxID=261450 RepID=A0A835HWH3_9MAGN|nr:hypothetical protein IFM89_025754 [Coptis chinensis]
MEHASPIQRLIVALDHLKRWISPTVKDKGFSTISPALISKTRSAFLLQKARRSIYPLHLQIHDGGSGARMCHQGSMPSFISRFFEQLGGSSSSAFQVSGQHDGQSSST